MVVNPLVLLGSKQQSVMTISSSTTVYHLFPPKRQNFCQELILSSQTIEAKQLCQFFVFLSRFHICFYPYFPLNIFWFLPSTYKLQENQNLGIPFGFSPLTVVPLRLLLFSSPPVHCLTTTAILHHPSKILKIIHNL